MSDLSGGKDNESARSAFQNRSLDAKGPYQAKIARQPRTLCEVGRLAVQKATFRQSTRYEPVIEAPADFRLEGFGEHQEFRFPFGCLSPEARTVRYDLVFVLWVNRGLADKLKPACSVCFKKPPDLINSRFRVPGPGCAPASQSTISGNTPPRQWLRLVPSR